MEFVVFIATFLVLFFVCSCSSRESDEICFPRPVGAKGEKGDIGSCTCNLTEIVQLKQRIEALEERLAENVSPDKGWFAPGNGYQYLLTSSRQNWQESRTLCQSMGGDLATVGMRDFSIRLIIARVIHGNATPWIGLNDISSEGTFVWIDGVAGTPENIHWNTGEPNNKGGGEDCVELRDKSRSYRSNDRSCENHMNALCEKTL